MKQNYLFLILPMLFCVNTISAQQALTGIVTDINGMSLPGATVFVKSANYGTTTDNDGIFSLANVNSSDVIQVSYIGYRTVEVKVEERQHIEIILTELPTKLDEVVVTGYSEISAKKRIASVAVLKSEQLENIPHTDINKFLQGNAAGVFSTAISGQPGTISQVRIRGTGSISAGRDPLYVVDGIISLNGNGAELAGQYNSVDLLAQFNPNDIESITILKDASATALYGSRGSNGVIVITTKRGKAGQSNITIKMQAGVTIPSLGNLKLMTAEEQWNYDRKVLANSGFSPVQIDNERPASMLDNTTNWQDEALNTGATYNLEVQAQGGNDKTRFFVSGGYFDQQGTLFGTDFNRLSLRSNIDHFASERLNFSLNLNGSYSQQNAAVDGFDERSLLLQALTNTPLQGKTNPATGKLYTGLEEEWEGWAGDNFLYSHPLNIFNFNTFRLTTKLSATYKILEHLHFTQNANVDWVNIDETDFADPTTRAGLNFNGYLANVYNNVKTLTTQSMLKYSNQFGSKHSFDALGIIEYQRHDEQHFLASGKGFASGKLHTLNSAAEPIETSGYKSQFAFLSFLGQANYVYKDRYVATASMRRDGSSRFGTNRRWANFWSAGASWLISDEGLLNDWSLLNNLRIRASFGTSGNADIGDFPALELYSFGENYLNEPGSGPTQISNPDLGWEKSNSLNIGVDFAILDNRIGGTVEWYNRKTEDLLLDNPVSATTGFTSAIQNIGKMRNSGFEIVLNLVPFEPLNTRGFRWNVDFNISFNDNEILELPNGADIIFGPYGHLILREGYPLHTLYMKKWAGVNPDDGTPLWEMENGNTTGLLSQSGNFIVGNSAPDFIAGLTNTFNFKGISLSMFFYTAQGQSKIDYLTTAMDGDGSAYGFVHLSDAAQHWENPGDNSSRPRPMLGGNNGSAFPSTRYLEDASYIRLRNVALSYQFPPDWMRKLKMQRITIYVQGQNLWTHTKYSKLNPEGPEVGLETARYPPSKSLVFGADVTF